MARAANRIVALLLAVTTRFGVSGTCLPPGTGETVPNWLLYKMRPDNTEGGTNGRYWQTDQDHFVPQDFGQPNTTTNAFYRTMIQIDQENSDNGGENPSAQFWFTYNDWYWKNNDWEGKGESKHLPQEIFGHTKVTNQPELATLLPSRHPFTSRHPS